jgi:hypothetical protein
LGFDLVFAICPSWVRRNSRRRTRSPYVDGPYLQES